MSGKAFLDTNVIVYAFAEDSVKGDVAERLLAAGGAISVQVLNEFAHVSRRKLALEWKEIEQRVGVVRALLDEPAPITVHLHVSACSLARRYGLGFYDALIVAAAVDAKCAVLYSEDLQHGFRIGALTVRNPFVS